MQVWVRSLGWEVPLKQEMAIRSYSCLGNPMDRGAWRAKSMGSKTESDLETKQQQQQKKFASCFTKMSSQYTHYYETDFSHLVRHHGYPPSLDIDLKCYTLRSYYTLYYRCPTNYSPIC